LWKHYSEKLICLIVGLRNICSIKKYKKTIIVLVRLILFSFRNLKTVFRSFRETRDANIIQRIVTRVNENPEVDLVIIIFGQAHFANLRRLIESNALFRFSDRSNGSI
jgi:hypothetical protein